MSNKFDVFISYNWKDENFVDLIINQLEKNNIKFFLDKVELKLYDKIDNTLKENIRSSKYLVAIISQNYLESYWCLFEAIEAILSEDLEMKFLPVMIKYNEGDVSFDENFIFESIENLDNKIANLEQKIIKYKVFALNSKLMKLNFIKSNLPKIFERTQDRIYPIFEIYKKDQLCANLEKFLNHIKSNSKVDFDLDSFSNLINNEQNKSPEISRFPTIKWEIYIGKQTWKNTPLILGDKIFIGSAGNKWNHPDEKDGVYCVNINTGREEWFYHTNSDVNKISFYDGLIVGGCDDGKFFCISSKTGKEKSVVQLDSGVVSSIYKEQDNVFIVATYNGTIYVINTKISKIIGYCNLEEKIMGDITVVKDNSNHTIIYIPTLEGNIFLLSNKYIFNNAFTREKNILECEKFCNTIINNIDNNCLFKYNIVDKIHIKYQTNFREEVLNSQLYSKPLVVNNTLFQGFIRDTYDDHPAIVCIDLKTKNVNWFSKDENNLSTHYGNIRTELLEHGNEIIFIHPYSNELVGLSKENGEVTWKINLGRSMFQQWASPILDKDFIYIPRHDGYLYKVNIITKKIEWGMYLGEARDAGAVLNNEQTLINEEESTDWEIYKGFSLLSTPAISKDNIIVGSDEGYLYCITHI